MIFSFFCSLLRVYALIDQNHFGDAKIDDCIILLGLVNETFGRIILSLFDSEKCGGELMLY